MMLNSGARALQEVLAEARLARHLPQRLDANTVLGREGHEHIGEPPVLGRVRVGAAEDEDHVRPLRS